MFVSPFVTENYIIGAAWPCRGPRVFGGVLAQQTFKRQLKIAAIIDKPFRTFTGPLFDTPMVENRRVKQRAILHAQMNGFPPAHQGPFDYFHLDSLQAAPRPRAKGQDDA
jgi:hypothetical protein